MDRAERGRMPVKVEQRKRLPTAKVSVAFLVPNSNPVCTCPRCGLTFRAESRTKAVCPQCGYRLLGGI